LSQVPLDNPFWSSLRSCHRHLALGSGGVSRFPPQYAPFLGVEDASRDSGAELDALVAAGETVLALGSIPAAPAGWKLERFPDLAQMVCEAPLVEVDGPEIILLDARHRADVLALTALVYPHYFRERTMELGRYFGIYQAGRLAAMIGERLGAEGAREMSAICTHPDFLGRGYARRLTAMLTNRNLSEGQLPYLHVAYSNGRALQLYRQMGYRKRADLPFAALTRP
jgi:ribosomal protein S18 acetylase RimI-like enzyme